MNISLFFSQKAKRARRICGFERFALEQCGMSLTFQCIHLLYIKSFNLMLFYFTGFFWSDWKCCTICSSQRPQAKFTSSNCKNECNQISFDRMKHSNILTPEYCAHNFVRSTGIGTMDCHSTGRIIAESFHFEKPILKAWHTPTQKRKFSMNKFEYLNGARWRCILPLFYDRP